MYFIYYLFKDVIITKPTSPFISPGPASTISIININNQSLTSSDNTITSKELEKLHSGDYSNEDLPESLKASIKEEKEEKKEGLVFISNCFILILY